MVNARGQEPCYVFSLKAAFRDTTTMRRLVIFQFRQSVTVDQNNALLQIFDIFESLLAESAGRNKNTFGCTKTNQAPYKALDSGSPDCLVRAIAFCLNINSVKTETILVNDSVDAADFSSAISRPSL